MAIGRAEDRDTPRNPVALRRHVPVRDPIRATHLGQRRREIAAELAAADGEDVVGQGVVVLDLTAGTKETDGVRG